jgi:hypothetical protein
MQIARTYPPHVCHTLQAYWRDVLLDTGFSIVDRENGLYDVTFTPNIVGEVRLRCGSQDPPPNVVWLKTHGRLTFHQSLFERHGHIRQPVHSPLDRAYVGQSIPPLPVHSFQ